MRTKVKICGIRSIQDGIAAGNLGADAIGLVFYPDSVRVLEPQHARAIIDAVPPFMKIVGLFMNAMADEIREIVRSAPVDLLQFHGDEPADFCRMFEQPYVKALAMGSGVDVSASLSAYPDAAAVLLDSHMNGHAGGTGQVFDWSTIPDTLAKPFILAGGLTPDNVVQAIYAAHPYAVDVSSGVESAPGVKDVDRMTQFIHEVNHA